MTIKLINHGTSGELLLEGRMDSNTAEDALTVMNQVADRFEDLILNFEKLEYISSAGLRNLKLLYVKMQAKGGGITIRRANPMVTEVLEMTGFVCLFKMEA